MKLSSQQQAVYDNYKEGKNIFITGPGGCGKTTLIRKMYENADKVMHLTALTGVAATQLHEDAKTLHSWAGIGLGTGKFKDLLAKINKSKATLNNWKKTDILVIDEISMLNVETFDLLDSLAKVIRNCEKPFGGIQVIMSGDFMQLPPVRGKFCNKSDKFDETFDIKMELDVIFRQKDERLVKILNNIRAGKITKSDIKVLNTRLNIKPESDPVILLPKKSAVDEINNNKLNSLSTEEVLYERQILEDLPMTKSEAEYMKLITIQEYQQELEYLEGSTLVLDQLKLKVGAKVMSTVNVFEDDKLVLCNGTRGTVKKFIQDLPYVEFENGVNRIINKHVWKCHSLPACGISQIPLVLSWALTIHKAQGSTLEQCRMNIGDDIFEAGQTYVALSRVKTLEGIFLDAFNPLKIRIMT